MNLTDKSNNKRLITIKGTPWIREKNRKKYYDREQLIWPFKNEEYEQYS